MHTYGMQDRQRDIMISMYLEATWAAVNNVQHSITLFSPFFTNYGYHLKSDFLVTLFFSHTISLSPTKGPYIIYLTCFHDL